MMREKFFQGILSGGLGFLIKTLAMLLLTPQMIMLLGVQKYGAYLILMSFSELSLLAASGMTTGFVQKMSQALGENDTDEHAALLISARWVYCLIAIIVLVVGWYLLPLCLPHLIRQPGVEFSIILSAAQYVLLAGVVNILGQYISGVLWAHCLHKQTNIIDTVRGILEAVIAVLILYSKGSLVDVYLGRLVIAVICLFVFFSLSWKTDIILRDTWYRGRCSLVSLKKLMSISIYATFEKISIFVAHRLDEVIIALYLTLTDVSCFGLVMRILSQISMLMVRLLAGVNPVFTRLKAQNEEDSSRFLFLRSISLMHYITIILLLLAMGCFPEFYSYMSDGKLSYHSAMPIAYIASILIWTGSVQIPASSYIFSTGYYRFSTLSTFITSACNLALSIYLVQHIGLPGVILGTLIPHGIQNHVVTIPFSLRLLKIKYSTYLNVVFFKTFPALVVPALLVIAMRYLGSYWFGKELLPFTYLMPNLTVIGLISGSIWVLFCLEKREQKLLLGLFEKIPNTKSIVARLNKQLAHRNKERFTR